MVKTVHCVATKQVVVGSNFDQCPLINYLHCFVRRTDHMGAKLQERRQ